jgi:hypothetical protein
MVKKIWRNKPQIKKKFRWFVQWLYSPETQVTEGFTAIKTTANSKVEYLKVKPGME